MRQSKMLLDLIRADATLERYICEECTENNVGVNIADEIERNNLLILKVDRYYNHLQLDPEKSPDCLIIQRCNKNYYSIYIVELRNIKNQSGFQVDGITEKFMTCLEDFMYKRFANYFHNGLFNFKNIRLIFVCDPYDFKNHPNRQEKMRGHKIDALMSQRIPRFFNKYLYIEHKLPNPTIRRCTA